MHIHFLTDEPNKIPKMRALLEPKHRVRPAILGRDQVEAIPEDILMVDADLRKRDRVEAIRRNVIRLSAIRERLFVVEKSMRGMIVQAQALGATAILSRPQEIVSRVEQIQAFRSAEAAPSGAAPDILDSARALATLFSAVLDGTSIDVADATRATHHVIDGVRVKGLATWLDEVRRYHQGTFQHCLLVTGVSVGFAMDLGFSPRDVERLGMAATLHDIGKARIPLTILDKPGKLEPDEEATMRLHPVIGFEAVKSRHGIEPEVLDAIRHHHEYLDGSGYPDGLSATDISDIVRLLTISDIFAALVEARPYRPPMPRPQAYDIVRGMEGKLEPALVRAFERVALTA